MNLYSPILKEFEHCFNSVLPKDVCSHIFEFLNLNTNSKVIIKNFEKFKKLKNCYELKFKIKYKQCINYQTFWKEKQESLFFRWDQVHILEDSLFKIQQQSLIEEILVPEGCGFVVEGSIHISSVILKYFDENVVCHFIDWKIL